MGPISNNIKNQYNYYETVDTEIPLNHNNKLNMTEQKSSEPSSANAGKKKETNINTGTNYGNIGGTSNSVINNFNLDPQLSEEGKLSILRTIKDYENKNNMTFKAINYVLRNDRSSSFATQLNEYLTSKGYPNLMDGFSREFGGEFKEKIEFEANGDWLKIYLAP